MNTIKKTLLGLTVMATLSMLSGCEKETKEYTNTYDLPKGMEDCKIFSMRSEGGSVITVVRCPLSSTTTNFQSGKTTTSSTIVEIPNKVDTSTINQGTKKDEVEINGEKYRRSESMKEIQINGESYKKVE